ncbi:MAG: hypothetical protein ACJZ62_04220 [Candidatus Pelagibacterales bacterium]|jgi:hypothetical protein|nr:hypothetical protein [Pelagibacteraceae bacterium]|tara:strand:+ start:74 stop:370 length:297 start_codon:yes stop_codon:yes gene_type:complete
MNFIKKIWSSIMDPNVNPLSNITNLKVRHMVMQILAFMWSGVFSLYIVDSIFVFGITSIAHVLFIAAIFITAFVFNTAKNRPQIYDLKSFRGKDGEHD